MTAAALVAELRRRGVTLEARGDRLRFKPATAVPPELREAMKANKGAILAEIRSPEPDGADLDSAPILAARQSLGAVLIRSQGYGDVWLALDQATADELLAEEARRDDPRAVLRPADIAALRGKGEPTIRVALDAARTFPGSRVIQ